MASMHVDSITASIKDFPRKLSVRSFELSLAINAIPYVILEVLPIETPVKGGNQYVTASAPNIKDVTKLYSELLGYASRLDTTGTIELHVIHDQGGEREVEEQAQYVTLEKWLLTDVGLSEVNAIAAPILTVTFSHPSIMLDKTGMIYEEVSNPMKLPEAYKSTGGSSIIPYMDALYQKYAQGTQIKFYEIASYLHGGPDSSFKQKVKEFRTKYLTQYTPGKYIDDRTQKMFLAELDSSLMSGLKMFSGYISAPRAFCGSALNRSTTMSRIITEICPNFMTTLIPTYDQEKLRLEPNSPWQASSYTITTLVTQSLDVTPVDPCPLIGTALAKRGWEATHVVNSYVRGKPDKQREVNTYQFHFPKRALDSSIKGQVLNLGEARIIKDLSTADQYANSTNGFTGPKGNNLQDAGNFLYDQKRSKLDKAFAEAQYLINYRANCRATITTIPIFKDAIHGMLYPGRVLTIEDRTTGSYLLFGYIARITVRGAADNAGSTTINLTHVRPTEEDRDIYVDEGTENPCYPKNIDRDFF